MGLRDYQLQAKADVYSAWQQGAQNVMLTLPTGGGKTKLFCSILAEIQRPACVIAHRQELIAQAALAFNRDRIPHGAIVPNELQRQIVALEHDTHGYSCFHRKAPIRVCGVDTLNARDAIDSWFGQVEYVVIDEGHHVLRDNSWGRAMGLFPRARGLYPTAHAVRADGRGLGRAADGLVDALVVGPFGRDLINRGYLCDYRVLCPPTDIDFSGVNIGSTGDFSLPQLRAVTHKSSRLVGDVVGHYLKYAAGKLGITFAVDIEAAQELVAAYRKAGVTADVITGKTPIGHRGKLMRDFRSRRILQLVSVDCLGEGVDVPAVEVVSLARKTASFQLFAQQIGRALRVMVNDELMAVWDQFTDAERLRHIAASDKPRAIILDHVGNVPYHGFPDLPREYSLARRESRSRGKPDGIPLRTCIACTQPYERVYVSCPYCGATPEPAGRGSVELVDGDLFDLDPAVMAALRGDLAKVNSPGWKPKSAAEVVQLRHHDARYLAQSSLRHAMALWGGWQKLRDLHDRELQRLFYHTFGIDVVSAQALSAKEAAALEQRIRARLTQNGVAA